jgi:folate-binding protein YgfZ
MTDAYVAARSTSVFVDRSDRGKLVILGADRASYLQGLLTNDIVALSPGDGCYAAYLTPQGRMAADMLVLDLGEGLLLDVHSSTTSWLVDRLREFVFTEEVTVEDRTSMWSAVGVHGPGSATAVSTVVWSGETADTGRSGDLSRLAEYHHLAGRFHGVDVVVARNDELGELGFIIYLKSNAVGALHAALSDTGVSEIDGSTFDVLRVEGGRPAFPADLDEETIPLEAGIEDRAISMTKGCYVGQEVIVRILHRGKGRVGRRFIGLLFDPDMVAPPVGAELTRGEKHEKVGAVTSAVWSPSLQRPIALGYVKRELSEPGTEFRVVDADRRWSAVVAERPFLPSSHSSPR